MVLAMKVSSIMVCLMERGNSYMQMEMFMMEIGIMVKQMVMEHFITNLMDNMKVNGKMMYNMDKENKYGQMDLVMKVIIKMV